MSLPLYGSPLAVGANGLILKYLHGSLPEKVLVETAVFGCVSIT